MSLNISSIKTSSEGAWQGDNPLNFAFPLLIVQTTVVLAISRVITFLLRPLRQPKVVAEIAGGILLGPSALGRSKNFLHWVFPSWSTPILESVASVGLLFFLFLVGLELDLSSIRRTGKRALGIAFAGISLPFLFGAGVNYVLRHALHGANRVSYGQSLVFMGVALSITAFPVLARILAELKLLTTHVGEIAMAAAAFNDVVAWIMLALAIALTGSRPGPDHRSPLTPVWVLASGVAFVVFMLVVVRPAMSWVASRCSPDHDIVDEGYICVALAGVMVSGFMTDLIGIHAIFGAFVFGLTIPKGGDFASRLMKRIEDFVSTLLLPLYFASSGLKTDVAKIHGAEAWGLLALVISTACAGKILGTFLVAMMCAIPARDSLALGVLMNTKGLVELIVLNIGREKKVLSDEMFTILVLMALFTTFITTPAVQVIYNPSQESSSHCRRHRRLNIPWPLSSEGSTARNEFRILTCIHGPGNVPAMVNLVELIRTTSKTLPPLKLYAMHLVELTDRSSSIMMVQRARRNGHPFVGRLSRGKPPLYDQATVGFKAYAEASHVVVRPMTAISALHTMHEDICHVAKHKRVEMIILPFHKQWSGDGENGVEELENLGHGWRVVNQRVLQKLPCSAAVLVDRGFSSRWQEVEDDLKRICVVFFGGPDDRKALELGGRMLESSAVRVTIVQFVEQGGIRRDGNMLQLSPEDCRKKSDCLSTSPDCRSQDKELDEEELAGFLMRWGKMVEYSVRMAKDMVEEVVSIGQRGEYDLIIAGKGRSASKMVAAQLVEHQVYPELGPIGDLLASSNHQILSSVLIVGAHINEPSAPMIIHSNCSNTPADDPSV
ncbi:hypothetical protein Nepgr_031923 [Nepenthes gracilis]|uniref:Cation/H+ exchanger domain-containing protein n=1 Tax=Nepenthes gracilis TaxID=150966 RepID=A0AAD3THM2_NEPGR|nr:hypothetical protein Nepgr_031923 [Nepenthes gracilis]